MNILTICPCCSSPLIHHFGNHREYWFCRHCWSEMPKLKLDQEPKDRRTLKVVNLSTSLASFNKSALVN